MSPCVISPLELISCLCLLLKQPLTSQMLIYNLHSLWLLLIFCQDCPPRKPPLPLSSPPIHPNPLPLPSSQNNSLLPLPQAPPLFQPLILSHPPPHPRPSSFQNGLLPLPQVPPPCPLPQTIYPPLPLSLPPSSLSSSSSTVLSLPSPTTSPPSFQPIHSTGPPHPPPKQQKVYTLSLSQSSLSILYFNVRNMLSNLSSLTSSVLLSNPDIVCIMDTWLSPDILSSDIGIPGFTLFRTDLYFFQILSVPCSSFSPVQLCFHPLHITYYIALSFDPADVSIWRDLNLYLVLLQLLYWSLIWRPYLIRT